MLVEPVRPVHATPESVTQTLSKAPVELAPAHTAVHEFVVALVIHGAQNASAMPRSADPRRDLWTTLADLALVYAPNRDTQAPKGEHNCKIGETFGNGTTDLGHVEKQYEIGVTIYQTSQADIADDLNRNPDIVLLAKQALNRASLAGAPSVYDTDLIVSEAWEHQPFVEGLVVRRFGMIFFSAEPRNG